MEAGEGGGRGGRVHTAMHYGQLNRCTDRRRKTLQYRSPVTLPRGADAATASCGDFVNYNSFTVRAASAASAGRVAASPASA